MKRIAIPCLLLALSCQTSTVGEGRTMEECSDACWRIASANCGDVGSECIDGCLRNDVPPQAECAVEQQRYIDCFWQTSHYTCEPDRGTTPFECDDELSAARSCLGYDAGDAAADASGPADANNPSDAAD